MLLISISERGAVPGVARREVNNLVKATLYELGVYWHKHFREKHFTRAGAKEYGYQPRSGQMLPRGSRRFWRSYFGRKLRRFNGNPLPLVWSGESRTLTELRDVRATSKRARVVLHSRKYNFRNPRSKIRMYEEMTTVSRQEEQELHSLADRSLDGKLETLRSSRDRSLAV